MKIKLIKPGILKIIILMIFSMEICYGTVIDTIYNSTFEDGSVWNARPGLTVTNISIPGRSKGMRITGTQPSAYNYVYTNNFAILPGHIYKFTAWIKVDSLNPTLAPFFKIELTTGTQIKTSKYDPWLTDEQGWQKIISEFECPEGNTSAWIAFEKGTNLSVYIDACIDDVLVVEIDKFSSHPYHFSTVPSSLKAIQGVHPRLYLTDSSLTALKSKLYLPPYATLLSRYLSVADKLVTTTPPVYIGDGEPEQLYQRDVGNAIPQLALAYLLTGLNKYRDKAKQYMLTSAGYPTWGSGTYNNADLATGHQLYGMALGYDWLYNSLDQPTLDSIKGCLIRRGGIMFNKAYFNQIYWTTSYLQNHLWVNMAGLSAAGFALYDGTVDVDGYILLPLEKFKRTMKSLGKDGANHEGIPYWEYGISNMLKFMELSRDLLGENLYSNDWFKNAAKFRLYGMLPMNFWKSSSSLMAFGDSPRYDWYGPDYILRRLAAEYNDGYAQWLADRLNFLNIGSQNEEFFNLLWVKPSVIAQPPDSLPTLHHFDDYEMVYLRSDWSGYESVTAFKCGPALGHYATSLYTYDPGSSHVHPDVGSFLIFAKGDWLIVDDGYTRKKTEFQNTLLINGSGQMGEGGSWFNATWQLGAPVVPRIVYNSSGIDYNYVIGDVKPSYPSGTNLTGFYRHLLFINPNCWIIADELNSSTPSTYDCYFHTDSPFFRDSTNRYKVYRENAAMRFTVLAPGSATTQPFLQTILGTDNSPDGSIPALKVSTSGTNKELFITIIEAYSVNKSPLVKPSIVTEGNNKYIKISLKDKFQKDKTWYFLMDTERPDKTKPLFIKSDVITQIESLQLSDNLKDDIHVLQSDSQVQFKVENTQPGEFTLQVSDIMGRQVWDYSGINRQEGPLVIDWNSARPCGIYFVTLKHRSGKVTRKFVHTPF